LLPFLVYYGAVSTRTGNRKDLSNFKVTENQATSKENIHQMVEVSHFVQKTCKNLKEQLTSRSVKAASKSSSLTLVFCKIIYITSR
jgi:hypothetical protein